MSLSNVVIVYETEASARRRLIAHGYAPEIADEIAVYLGQATDLPDFFDEIAEAAGKAGLVVEFVELERLLSRLLDLAPRRETTLVWSVTDGVRFYRGSAAPALARLPVLRASARRRRRSISVRTNSPASRSPPPPASRSRRRG